MKITTQIVRSPAALHTKIVQLFAVVMTNYRQTLGDEAWEEMVKLIGREQVHALAFLTGMMMGTGEIPKHERWLELLPKKTKKTKSKKK